MALETFLEVPMNKKQLEPVSKERPSKRPQSVIVHTEAKDETGKVKGILVSEVLQLPEEFIIAQSTIERR